MKLKKEIIMVTIALIAGALLGLTGLQIYLLQNAVEKERRAFAQNVNATLSNVVQNLETREAVTAVFNMILETDQDSTKKQVYFDVDEKREVGNVQRVKLRRNSRWFPDLEVDSTRVIFFLPTQQHVRLRLLDSTGTAVQDLVNRKLPSGKNEVELAGEPVRQGTFGLSFISDSLSYIASFSRGEENRMALPAGGDKQRVVVNRVLDELAGRKPLAIEDRIDRAVLDSLISAGLAGAGIETPFAYGIVSSKNDSVLLANRPGFDEQIRTSKFQAALFPGDIFRNGATLAVTFPQQELYLFGRVASPIGIAILFIGILIFCFIYILRMLFNQRAFSQRLTSFINNMTHEFKTPLSTIALASEAIANPKSQRDEKRLLRYGTIIRDENQRMQRQVEKILQMAVLEEGDFDLNLTPIDVHDLLNQLVQKFKLQVESRKGEIETEFDAERSVIRADTVHLSNIISSLLDNALKYTERPPKIAITTSNGDGSLQIRVADNGIGLRPEERSRIFEKYYRVPTGNRHDVKGFGLGLSYVKLMVEAHGGNIAVTSQVSRGTTFTLSFPVAE